MKVEKALVTFCVATSIGSCIGQNASFAPTLSPTSLSGGNATVSPTFSPTVPERNETTSSPTTSPTVSPTLSPSLSPSVSPSLSPTGSPTVSPTTSPTPRLIPTKFPTKQPVVEPSEQSVAPTSSLVLDGAIDCDWGWYANGTECVSMRVLKSGIEVFGVSIASIIVFVGCILAPFLGDATWLALGTEYLWFVQLSALGAVMDLPAAPVEYVQYSFSYFWSFFALIPYDGAWNMAGCEVASFDGEQGTETIQLAQFCETVNIAPRRALLACITAFTILFVIAWLAFIIWTLSLPRDQRRSLCWSLSRSVHAVLFVGIFPLSLFAMYTFYVLFLSPDESLHGCDVENMMSCLIAGAVVTMILFWGGIGLRSDSKYARTGVAVEENASTGALASSRPETSSSILSEAFRPGCRSFWFVMAAFAFLRGLFIGLIVFPRPIQPAFVLGVSVVYCILLLWLAPFSTPHGNKIANMLSQLSVINSVIPVFFGTESAILKTEATEILGTVQIGINVVSLVLVAIIAVGSTLYMIRKREIQSFHTKPNEDPQRKPAFNDKADQSSSPESMSGGGGFGTNEELLGAVTLPTTGALRGAGKRALKTNKSKQSSALQSFQPQSKKSFTNKKAKTEENFSPALSRTYMNDEEDPNEDTDPDFYTRLSTNSSDHSVLSNDLLLQKSCKPVEKQQQDSEGSSQVKSEADVVLN